MVTFIIMENTFLLTNFFDEPTMVKLIHESQQKDYVLFIPKWVWELVEGLFALVKNENYT